MLRIAVWGASGSVPPWSPADTDDGSYGGRSSFGA